MQKCREPAGGVIGRGLPGMSPGFFLYSLLGATHPEVQCVDDFRASEPLSQLRVVKFR